MAMPLDLSTSFMTVFQLRPNRLTVADASSWALIAIDTMLLLATDRLPYEHHHQPEHPSPVFSRNTVQVEPFRYRRRLHPAHPVHQNPSNLLDEPLDHFRPVGQLWLSLTAPLAWRLTLVLTDTCRAHIRLMALYPSCEG